MTALGKLLKKITLRPYKFHPNAERIKYVTEFKNGFALALFSRFYEPMKVVIINSSYQIATPTEYECILSSKWSNGYIIATNHGYVDGNTEVFLDRELREVPDKIFSHIVAHNNYFIVSKKMKNQSEIPVTLYGVLDSDLNEILTVKYSYISAIGASQFFGIDENNRPFVFDASTKDFFYLEKIHRVYKQDKIGYYKFVSDSEKRLLGYLDKEFNVVIEAKYNTLGDFDKNGLAPFTRGNVVGAIDITGKEFIR